MRKLHVRMPRKFARDERGSQLIEFAVVATLLIVTMLSIIDFSRAMYAYHFVSYAAEEGARWAMVRGSDWTATCSTSAPPSFTQSYDCTANSTDVQNYVQSLATAGITSSSVSASSTWPGTTPDCTSTPCTACTGGVESQGCYVSVKVTYPFTFLLPFLPHSTLSMTATAEKVIQY